MRISRVRIVNFANFANLDIVTGSSLVVVGENKVGKSNFIRALQLVLDPGLSDRDRMLSLEHFWDGLGDEKLGSTVEIAVEFTDFDNSARLLAHLGDCIVSPGPPMVARLTYRYQPKANLTGDPKSLADYEYIIFGGDDPDNGTDSDIRRYLPLDVQKALRDAEGDLASWRRSPLRPLIEELTASLDAAARAEIQKLVDGAHSSLTTRTEVKNVAQLIAERLIAIAGEQHAVPVSLGLAPTQVDHLLRGLRLLIDGGARGITDASLGTANLIFFALKSLELDRLVNEGARDHTFFAVEEPEAHLHPHVQRLVYRYFLDRSTAAGSDEKPNLTTILTTHSPHIASVSPLRSIVLLRQDGSEQSTVGISTAGLTMSVRDEADLQRYIDVNRGELFFARGIILVEGDAEKFLIPAFAAVLDIPLDVLGISVCSVSGTNFAPYVKMLSKDGLAIPHVLLTDRDLVKGKAPRAEQRMRSLLAIVDPGTDYAAADTDKVFGSAETFNYFVNDNTLEIDLFAAGLGPAIKQICVEELRLGTSTQLVLDGWIANRSTLDGKKLIGFIERIGKGRFAQALAAYVTEETCPPYIEAALRRICDDVS